MTACQYRYSSSIVGELQMPTRLITTILTILLVLLLVGHSAAPAAVAVTIYSYDFESSLTPWGYGADPNVTGALYRASANNNCPAAGSWSARLEITSTLSITEGIWMTASFTNTVTDTAKLEFTALNAYSCWGCTPMAYLGNTAPTSSSQFTDFTPLPNSGWQGQVHRAAVTGSTVYAAVGWHGPAQTGTYPKAVDIDCVTVLIP